MNAGRNDRGADGRLGDLLADRALFGLDAAEDRELAGLLEGRADADREEFERLAAATAIALGSPAAGVPADLRSRLFDEARRFAAGDRPRDRRRLFGRPSLPVRGGLVLIGMVAAAACVLIMVVQPDRDGESTPDTGTEIARDPAVSTPPAGPPVQPVRSPTPALQRDEMLASVPDAQTIDCEAADGGDEGSDSAGDVVWSDQRRRGFLRVRGLARSEPGRVQYRIWILNGGRTKPVSGGVFQVAEENGEVVVPILPQAPVQGPTMFVVTAEEPGSDGEFNADRARVVARAD